jgi:DNA-binding NarL/FixJ family response regulator
MRVLLADGHPKVRQALRMFLEEEPGLIIVGEVSEVETLLSEAKALLPDFIVLEWELQDQPETEMLRAIRALRDLSPSCHVIALSSRTSSEQAALAAGADGFVSKTNGPEALLAVLRRLIKDERG